jgi:hypothetical protein
VAREVRVRSKFGCVVCRSAICDYEHIDPEYADAKAHDPQAMCLLCGRCHGKVTRGRLSKATVLEKYLEVQASDDIKRPFDDFDLSGDLTLHLGSCTFHGARTLVEIDGEKVLAIEPPEEGSSFPTLTGYFTDASGRELLRIERNIWSGPATAWDVEVKGPTITVRPSRGVVGLRLRVDPPNEIFVEKLDMRVGDSHLQLQTDWLDIGRVQEGLEYNVGIEKMECFVPEVAVQVDAKGFPNPEFRELSIVGGEGIDLVGTGIRLGVGNGMMTVKGVRIERASKTETHLLWIPFEDNDVGYEGVLPPRL